MLFPHLNLQEQSVVTGRKTRGQRGDDRIISKLKPECAGTSLPFLYGFLSELGDDLWELGWMELTFLALWAMSGVLVSSFSIRYSLFCKTNDPDS